MSYVKKPKRLVLHVTQTKDGKWQFKGGSYGPERFSNKAMCIAEARIFARARPPSQIVVHSGFKAGNEIQFENTYGNDPVRTLGVVRRNKQKQEDDV